MWHDYLNISSTALEEGGGREVETKRETNRILKKKIKSYKKKKKKNDKFI